MFTEYGKLVKILNSRSKNAIDPHKIGLGMGVLKAKTTMDIDGLMLIVLLNF
jgi:hypothetical protein